MKSASNGIWNGRFASAFVWVGGALPIGCLMVAGLIMAGSHSDGREPSTPESGVERELPAEREVLQQTVRADLSQQPAVTAKVGRYARHLLSKYDVNRDGELQRDEWQTLHGQPEFIDQDGDGVVSLDELSLWIADYGRRKRIGVPAVGSSTLATRAVPKSEAVDDVDSKSNSANSDGVISSPGERRRDLKFFVPAKRIPQGLPDWFLTRDLDGDGQLTAGEYSPTNLAAELAEFALHDANGDGVLTAKECVRKSSGKGGAGKDSAR